jgi:hypothetical protein
MIQITDQRFVVLRSQIDELNEPICDQNANTCKQVKTQRHKAVPGDNSEVEL